MSYRHQVKREDYREKRTKEQLLTEQEQIDQELAKIKPMFNREGSLIPMLSIVCMSKSMGRLMNKSSSLQIFSRTRGLDLRVATLY